MINEHLKIIKNETFVLNLFVGPGEYQVVKCGPSGHNIRCRPHLKATPIGMLIHGEKITVIEDVSKINFPSKKNILPTVKGIK